MGKGHFRNYFGMIVRKLCVTECFLKPEEDTIGTRRQSVSFITYYHSRLYKIRYAKFHLFRRKGYFMGLLQKHKTQNTREMLALNRHFMTFGLQFLTFSHQPLHHPQYFVNMYPFFGERFQKKLTK